MAATLINSQGKKVVVNNDAEAKNYFGQGYTLMGAKTPVQQAQDPLSALAKQYQQQQQDYQNATLARNSFADALQKALQGADQGTATLRNQALALQEQQYNAPNTLRDELMKQGITDPFARQRLIDQRLGSLNTAYGQLQNTISSRGGRLEDVLKAGQGAYDTELQAKQYSLQSIAEQLKAAQAQAQAQAEAEAKAQELQQKFQQEIYLAQLKASLSGKSGGSRGSSNKPLSPSQQSTANKTTAYNDLLSSLNSAADYVVTTYTPKSGQGMTREQLIGELTRKYGNYVPASTIAKTVYSAYPDSFR